MHLGEFDQFRSRCKRPFPPGCDDADIGVECVSRQLEPHLVVAFAGRAVGHGVGPGFGRDLDKALGNQRSRDGGAEKIESFVNGIGAEHREHEVADEFLPKVLDVDFLHPEHLGLGAGRLELFTLAEIGREGHDLASVFRL